MTPMPADATIATSQDRRREVRARHHNGLDLVEVHENRRGLTVMFLEQAPAHIGPAGITLFVAGTPPTMIQLGPAGITITAPKITIAAPKFTLTSSNFTVV